MQLKIGDIAKQSGTPASTIRYYVKEGLLPKPRKINEKMAYYDAACIERLQVINQLQAGRYFPLHLIKNILRRMDEGLTLTEAEAVENAVFGLANPGVGDLMTREAFLGATGLTDEELQQVESLGLLMPFAREGEVSLYNHDDVRVARDGLKRLLDLGMQPANLTFVVELGQEIVAREMVLRRRLVEGKSTRANVAVTAELTRIGDFFRDYVLRRLFQRQVDRTIRKSLSSRTSTSNGPAHRKPNRKTIKEA